MSDVIAAMPKYEAYRDSGVEWLGEVPTEWRLLSGKRFHKVVKQPNTNRQCSNILSLTLRGVVNNDPDDPEGLVPKDYGTYQIFEKDDLVFKLIDLENFKTSRVGLVHEKGIMSPAYIRLQLGSGFNPRFAYYFYFTLYLNAVYNNLGAGVRSTLGPTDLLEIGMLQPTPQEQAVIAAFLDRKTAQIDQAVSIKERQIELLKERKQILIQNAVTRGLTNSSGTNLNAAGGPQGEGTDSPSNPDAPMKDSGVDWIGEIPSNWELSKLRACLKSVSVKNRPDLPLLSITREKGVILRDVDDQDKNHNFIPDDLSGYKVLECGQFGMNKMKAWQGSYGVSNHTGIVSPAYFIFEFAKDIEPKFFHVAIRSRLYVSFFGSASDGVRIGQWDLSKSRMKQIPFLIPTREEQSAIVDFIETESSKIDQAIELQQQQIDKLKEYKATLIDSAVTGKIRVVDEIQREAA